MQVPEIPLVPVIWPLGSWIWSSGSPPGIKQATVAVVTNRSTLIATRAPANLAETLSAQIMRAEPSPLLAPHGKTFPGSEPHHSSRQEL